MRKNTASPPFWIPANWPAPENIHAGTTIRKGGISNKPYDSLNLAQHVGDDPDSVFHNRQKVVTDLGLPNEPVWLEQVHGNRIIDIARTKDTANADGAYTNRSNHVCVVMTADCLPLLITDKNGREIAAIHVGWRGYASNIVGSALGMFKNKPENLLAWTGPCIHAEHYEVDNTVRDACLNITPLAIQAFKPSRKGHWYANLELLVRNQLGESGLLDVFGGDYCTYRDVDIFYSYRRDGSTGRIATMIWMDSF